jgi:hypothetical protein
MTGFHISWMCQYSEANFESNRPVIAFFDLDESIQASVLCRLESRLEEEKRFIFRSGGKLRKIMASQSFTNLLTFVFIATAGKYLAELFARIILHLVIQYCSYCASPATPSK